MMSSGSPRTIAVPPVAKTAPITTQPKADAVKMKTLSPQNETQEPCVHNQAQRLRGGGAAKDCFLGLFACFMCFECCEGCCDCIADILCASSPALCYAELICDL
ncbi:hypothetical protein D9615_006690 [Tricholomella constricta]|uniref:Uncharacterized protein n=1 Tax=Tricholomella constricta TaxID=117010 RepID=A0A8H5H6X4_9AGAR|nr:hypothetical protein D9615_006690 [Tricholomella constricta]